MAFSALRICSGANHWVCCAGETLPFSSDLLEVHSAALQGELCFVPFSPCFHHPDTRSDRSWPGIQILARLPGNMRIDSCDCIPGRQVRRERKSPIHSIHEEASGN